MKANLKQLDQLILEAMREANLIEREAKKGGVEGGKKKASKAEHLGLNIAEILSIISLGTETGKDVKSSVTAVKTLISSTDFKKDFSNSRALAESFRFFRVG